MGIITNPGRLRLPGPAASAFIVWLLLAFLPVIAKMLGYNFLPSTHWISAWGQYGLAVGVISALLAVPLMIKATQASEQSKFRKGLTVVGGPLMAFVLGKNIIVVTTPMILAMIIGQQTELIFTVAKADGDGSRRCRSPVELGELPLLFDRLCHIPDEVRRNLPSGSHIGITGTGTSAGIYAETLQRVD